MGYSKTCDYCGNHSEEVLNANNTAKGWFRINTMKMYHRPKNCDYKKDVPENNILYIRDDDDPDFCSIECALGWFEKELKKI
jgi:DNA/RNA endonuclease YhcR with UshA esterase domain